MQSLTPILQELERFVTWFGYNHSPVVLTIQTAGKRSVLGTFTRTRWDDTGNPIHEVNLSAEHLNRHPMEILETIAHELVHLRCCEQGIKDTSKSGYHNKRFKLQAEELGLLAVTVGDSKGYAYTSLTDALATRIETSFKPNERVFGLYRCQTPKVEKTSKTLAYTCSCEDGPTVRVAMGKPFNATCRDCDSPFEPKL